MTSPLSRNAMPNPAGPRSLDTPDWHQTYRLIWRSRWTVILAALTAGCLGFVYAAILVEPRYTAEALVMLDPQDDQVLEFRSVVSELGRDERIVNTEVEVLRSRSLLGRVVDSLSLTEDAEFNTALNRPQNDAPFGLTFLNALSPAHASRADPPDASRRNATISRLAERITIRNPPDTLVFTVSVTTDDPKSAADIANSLTEHYVQAQIQSRMDANERATAWLSNRVAELKQEVEQNEARAKIFGPVPDSSDDTKLEALLRQSAALQQRLTGETDDRQVFDAELELLSARISAESEALVEKRQLERDAEASRLIYEYFLTRLKETAIQRDSHRADSRILSTAVLPTAPSFPHIPFVLVASLMLGAGLGVAGILLAEALQTRLRTPDEVERYAGLPVLGVVPDVAGASNQAEILGHALRNRSDLLAESVRQLRTGLLLAKDRSRPKVVLLTSSVADEGKTALSLLLAENMSGLGRKVLLIEADLRRPSLAKTFDLSRRPGLVAVLAKAVSVDTAISRIEGLDADVLTADQSVLNTADLLATARFAEFISEMRLRYDHIIIDSAPVLAVPDGRIVAPLVDSFLYLVAWNATARAELGRGLGLYRALGLEPAGLVLTRVDHRRMLRFGAEDGYGYGLAAARA